MDDEATCQGQSWILSQSRRRQMRRDSEDTG